MLGQMNEQEGKIDEARMSYIDAVSLFVIIIIYCIAYTCTCICIFVAITCTCTFTVLYIYCIVHLLYYSVEEVFQFSPSLDPLFSFGGEVWSTNQSKISTRESKT